MDLLSSSGARKIAISLSLFIVQLFLFPFTTSSQTGRAFIRVSADGITGKVRDISSGRPLPDAFVQLWDRNDSVSQSVYTDSAGVFLLSGISPDVYTLHIIRAGFLRFSHLVNYRGGGLIDLGAFGLFPERVDMEDITVKTTRQLVQYDADKVIYRVEDDPQSKGSMLIQILKKIPGIVVENNRNITVYGNSNYLVLVNGRRSSLFVNDPNEVFRSFPASAVKQIEILTTPPSRYESEFLGGVINLILDQYTINGYRGSVNTQLVHPPGFTGSSYLTAKAGILGVNAFGSLDSGKEPEATSDEYILDRTFGTVTLSEGFSKGNYSNGNYNTEISVTPDARNLVSITTSGKGDRGRSNDFMDISEMNDDLSRNEEFISINQSYSARSYSMVQADYEHRSKSPDKHLYTVSVRSVSNKTFIRDKYHYLDTSMPLPERSQAGHDDIYREGTAQMDYVFTFNKQSLEAGIKNIHRNSRSDYFQENWDSDEDAFYRVPDNSSRFSFLQSITGGYTSLNFRYKNYGLKVGARAEVVGLDVNFISTETTIQKHYFNVIPAVRFNGRFNKAGRYNFAYTQRVQRPGLMYLNPFVNRTEVLYHYYGNPDLDPAVSHVYHGNYALLIGKGNYSISGNYSESTNSIQSYYFMGADSILYNTFANIGRFNNTGITLSMSRQFFDMVTFNISGSVRYSEYSGSRGADEVINRGKSYSGNVYLGFPVLEDGYFSGSGSWISGGVNLQGKNSGALNTHFSFSWDPKFKRNLTLDLSVDNLFRKMQTRKYTIDNQHFYMVFNQNSQVRMVAISANYRFGEFKGVLKRKIRDIVIDDQVE